MVPVPEEEEEAVVRAPRLDKPKWLPGIGTEVRFDPDYMTPGGVQFSANWQIRCAVHGKKCTKKKHQSEASTTMCGDIEPLAFLHAWIPVPPAAGKSHAWTDPTDEEAKAYAE